MRQVTLCLLTRLVDDTDQVCLGWKKTGFAANRWAGIGGKVENATGETVAQAARRELREKVRWTGAE